MEYTKIATSTIITVVLTSVAGKFRVAAKLKQSTAAYCETKQQRGGRGMTLGRRIRGRKIFWTGVYGNFT